MGEEKINEDQITVRWIISNDKIGHLIGRGGDGIKEINNDSGAWVKVAHSMEMPSDSTERLVSIMGTEENVEKARQMIEGKYRVIYVAMKYPYQRIVLPFLFRQCQ